MTATTKALVLKYGIPAVALIVIAVQVFLIKTKNLSKWKGGGYGMYTEIHYVSNQIYIPGMHVDSLVKVSQKMKNTLGYLMLMPNKDNLIKSAKLILNSTEKDSIHIQIWKPVVNSENGYYWRELIDEVKMKNTDF